MPRHDALCIKQFSIAADKPDTPTWTWRPGETVSAATLKFLGGRRREELVREGYIRLIKDKSRCR
jgi:hypothetical protein